MTVVGSDKADKKTGGGSRCDCELCQSGQRRRIVNGLQLILVMSSQHNSTGRIFLVLLACLIFIIGVANQVSGSIPQSSASTRTHAPASMFSRGNHKGGRLIVQRTANFGNDLFLNLSIDGREVAKIAWNYRYGAFIPAGAHVLTVLAMPRSDVRRPSSTRVTIRPGRTYVFTAVWESDRVVLRRTGEAK